MQELLRNAVNGWFEYTDAGKYAVLFLGILLCYWYRAACAGKQKTAFGTDGEESRLRMLMVYASIMAAVAIFPLTAVVLMKYQTKFYDYKWVWSTVPVTLVIACGMTWLYRDCIRGFVRGKRCKTVGLLAVGAVVIVLCGNLYTEGCKGAADAEDRTKTAKILDKLAESGDTDTICLWAPRDIMAHVRGLNGDIVLLYGRNMWEASLNAYAYDVYDQETVVLYEWMEDLMVETSQPSGQPEGASGQSEEPSGQPEGASGQSEEPSGQPATADRQVIETAMNKGVNCILVPEERAAEISGYISDAAVKMKLTVTQQAAEGYYIYRIRS